MDNQLHRTLQSGARPPLTLTDADLPDVARAIVAAMRRQAGMRAESYRGRNFLRIRGTNVDALVYEDAWNKIAPYIADGTFSSRFFPVLDAPNNPSLDPLYVKVLGVLRELFPTTFPT